MLIAVAGGIGVGKSAVMDTLRSLGANTLATDEINRKQLSSPSYIEKLSKIFPMVVKDGIVDKKKLREIIFTSDTAREKLNQLAHPLIMKKVLEEKEKLTGLVFVEIPLLIESGSREMFDKVWLVTAPLEDRIKRITARDDISNDSASAMILAQKGEERVKEFADDIIDNSEGLEGLKKKVTELYFSYERQSNTTL